MSDTTGKYHFQAWARRGIGAAVDNPDTGVLPDRASLTVQLALQVQNATQPNPILPPAVTVQLFGPGDVVGIDPRHVIKTEPRQFTVNYEPNYLCGIEFDAPDFPWLLTPAAPKADRLHPWVALIVLKSDEFQAADTAPLPTVTVLKTSALHDLSSSWNWAHVQVSGDSSLRDTLASTPGHVISRLLCPRRLDPELSYSAFLVPAFKIGVQAGLGADVSSIHKSEPAWTPGIPGPLTLPFYYRFDFHTSDEGDFESLVRRLVPRVLPEEVGERPMDVSEPDPGFPSAGDPLGLEGAVHSVLTQPTPWSGPDKDAFQAALQPWINETNPPTDDPASPNPDDPVVAPPIYGQWHAAVRSVDRTVPGWITDLNLDPRNRAAAAMGTQIVQDERTALMASAWQQVAGVLEANQKLKQAQLARAASQQVYRQHFILAQSDTVLYLTSPLHSRVLASPTTVKATVRNSRVPERMFSGAFRKAARLPWHLGMARPGAATLLDRVNSGDVTIVPPPKPPGGMTSIDQISDQSAPTWAERLLKYWPLILWLIVAILLLVVLILGVAVGWGVAGAVAAIAAAGIIAFYNAVQGAIASADAADQVQFVNLTPQAVSEVPPRPGFQVEPAGTPLPAGGSGTSDSAQGALFRTATSQLFAYFQALPDNPAPRASLDIAALRTTLLTRLDPIATIAKRFQGLIDIDPRLRWDPPDLLEPIMAAPEFPQPMYAPLRDLSEQYFLPGAQLVVPDTVGLLETNHTFIESYMVGLNHEMARQLLWNGYPTDQRGSYFRQFWDVSAYVPTKSDPTDPAQLKELLKDIPPIHTWPLPDPLGDHPNRRDIVPNNLVLLVRGELFKRYPNAIVYAGKAKRAPDGTRILDETAELYQLFRGTLTPDMTFIGFNLSADEARGGTAASPDGYFFVFQEQPSEPRFGLEPDYKKATPVAHWSELAWTHFGGGGAPLKPAAGPAPPATLPAGSVLANSPWRMASRFFSYVLANTAVPDFLQPENPPIGTAIVTDSNHPEDGNNQWGVNSAQTANILLRVPYRILIHADLMLPKP